jgi:hypothetical protein
VSGQRVVGGAGGRAGHQKTGLSEEEEEDARRRLSRGGYQEDVRRQGSHSPPIT